jgi:hypothetical protein
MYRESDLMTCLFGLAGWRQNANPEYPTLPDYLTASASGLYFQDAHPLLTIENIDQSGKNYDHYAYDAYTAGEDYLAGERVRYTDTKVYAAKTDLSNVPGVLNPADWDEVILLAQKIESMTKAGINKVATAVTSGKKVDGLTKSIFENVQLFGGMGDITQKEVKQGRFVGLQIQVKSARDISVLIRRIGTQFSAANPNFKLWLFHSSQSEPVTSITLNLTRANAFNWSVNTNADLILKYLSPQLFPGGSYYLGYYEDDLEGMAINKGYNWAGVPACGTCNNDLALFNQWSSFISVTPFAVPAEYLEDIRPTDPDGPFLWDTNVNQWNYSKNFGLNLDLTTACDLTDFFCREGRLFTDAIIKQVAVDALNEMAYSTRNNVLAKETRDLAIYALNDEEKKIGLVSQLNKAIEALSFDFSDLNELCLPCNNPRGLDHAVW